MQSFLQNRQSVEGRPSADMSPGNALPKLPSKKEGSQEVLIQSIPVTSLQDNSLGGHAPKIDVVMQDGRLVEIKVKCSCGMEMSMGVES